MQRKKAQILMAVAMAGMFLAILAVPFVADDRVDPISDEMMDEEFLAGFLDGVFDAIRHGLSAPFQWIGEGSLMLADWIRPGDLADLPPGSTGNVVQQFARNAESLSTQEKIMLVSQLANSLVDNDRQVFALSESYLNRAAEITSASLWHAGATFNSDDVLILAGVIDLLARANYNTQYTLDWAYDQAANRVDLWAANTDWASELRIQMGWNGGGTADATSRLNLDFTSIMTATSAENVFYLDTESMAGTAGILMNNAVWSFSPNAGITDLRTGTFHPFGNVYTDISSLPSGWYVAEPGVYAGPFLASTSPAAAAVTGGAVIICDNTYGYITADANGLLNITYDGVGYTSDYLRYGITADGNVRWTEDAADGSSVIASMITTYARYFDQIKELQFRAAASALTMWMISAQAFQSNILLSPSSIIPQLTNVGVDPVQAYAMYVSALEQIAQFWNMNGTLLRSADVRISPESLDLYCYGSIYNPDGSLIAANVVFTPYVYTQSMNIRVGSNTYTSAGMVMIWDDLSTTAIGWEGSSTNNAASITIMPGAYFMATEVVYKGESVPSVTLQVKTIQAMGILTNAQLGLDDTPAVISVAALFMIIFILLGIILMMAGFMWESGLFKIIGVIVAILGLLASSFLARLILSSDFFDFLYLAVGAG